eukprot:TRINITY_DN3901_c0_g1_i2.p1 TRINITY_DN3901_c0_g1~~TRINITY_DN3901_c0_g1_i2.p1  ORF type:complete len:3527 (-),score=831.98 TRINITY_DN3901_c0_g1_i2:238-9594(-)
MAESKRVADDLTRLIETANAPIFGVDAQGRVTEWNQKLAELSQYPQSECIGKMLVDNFISEKEKGSVSYVFLKAMHGEETANFKLPLVKNGKLNAILLLNVTTRRGPDGEPIGVIGVGQDITSINALTAEQQRVMEDLSRLIDSANAPIFGVDTQGMVTEWNRKAADILRYDKKEAIGKNLVQTFIQPENRKSVDEILSKALAGVDTANFELPLLSKHGERYTVLLNATSRRDGEGNITGVVGVGQDITELNQVLAESKRVADDLTRLIETANAPIFGIDTEGRVTEWNAKASSLLGFSKAETIGKSLVDNFITESFRDSVNAVLNAALAGNDTANFEFPLFTKNQERRDILLNATTRRGPNGEVIGVIGVGQDITQIREITSEQERIADDLSRLIENANAPIFGVDLYGCVTEWNRKAAMMTGFTKQDTMGRNFVQNFIEQEGRQSVTDVLKKAFEGEETANFNLTLLSKHGERYTVLLNATSRRDAKGSITGVVGVGQDITELNQVLAESKRVADDLTRLIETANAPIFGIDIEGRVTEWNAKASSLLGFSKAETMGQSLVHNFVKDEFKSSVKEVLDSALIGKETANFEFPMFTKTGERRDILLNATTRRGPNDEVIGVIGVGQDITEIRQITSEQKSVADDLSALIENANAPIFGVDLHGMVTEWNRKAATMTGFAKQETMGKNFVKNFIQYQNRQSVSEVLRKACAGQDTDNFHLTLHSKHGDWYTVLLNATSRRDAKGNITGVVGVGQDITELNQVLAESKRVADDLTRLIETANAPIFGIDTEGRVTEWNAKASSLLGFSKEEALGQSLVQNFIKDEFKNSVKEVLDGALVGKEKANFEFGLFTKTGERRDILLNATTRRGPNDEVTGVIGVGQDITEIRQISSEQKSVADDLSRLIENANAPIFGVDLNGLVTEWNRKAADMLGYTKQETMGKKLVQVFIQAEHRASVAEVLQNALVGKETANFELSLLSKHGERYTVLLNATTRRDGKGAVTGVVGVGQDITELNQVLAQSKRVADDLTRLIDTANAPIFGIDVNGNVNEWNAKASSLLGFSKEEALGKSLVQNFIKAGHQKAVHEVLARALVGMETDNFEFPLFSKEGQRKDILLNATTRRGPDGDVIGVIGVGQDITGIREITTQQQLVADDLSRLIESANAPIFGVDLDGMVTEWNRKAADMLGYTKAETMGKNLVHSFIQRENQDSVFQVLANALKGEETANYELPLLSKYGERYTVLLNATTRTDGKGKVTGVVGVGQDITDLNKVMAQSKSVADDLTQLIETANAPIFGIDTEGKISEWNKKTAEITGFTSNEALGKNLVNNFIHLNYRESVNEVLRRALNGHESSNYELPIFTKCGMQREILLNATTRRSPSGSVIGVVGVGQDITDLKQAHKRAEKIADDLTRLIETANAPIFGIDNEGNVSEWNAKATEIIGWSKEEAMGANLVTTFIHVDNRAKVQEVLQNALNGKETSNFELPLWSKDGRGRNLLLNATPRRGEDGSIVGVVSVGQDITELNKQRTEAMNIADDLQRIVETANAPILGVDVQGRVTEWNLKLAELSRVSKREAEGKPLVQSFITTSHQEPVGRILMDALDGKPGPSFELPLVKDGQTIAIVLLNATPRCGPKGDIIGVICVGQDITEIYSMKEEQQRMTEDLSRLIDSANAPIFGVDIHGMVTEWNQKAADMLGYTKQETIGKHLAKNFIQEENRDEVEKVLRKALAGVETANYRVPLLSKRGNRYTVLLNATTRRDGKGHIIGVVGVGQDITDLNHALSESKRVADDLTQVIETANAPIFGIDAEGRVTEWNAKASGLLGYSKHEALGKSLVQHFITDEFKDSVRKVLDAALDGQDTANFEFPLFTATGERKEILLNATARRGPSGDIIGVIGVGQDITRIREVTKESERVADDLSRLIENANAPIFGVDMHGMVTEWNRKAADLLGYTKDETMGKHLVKNFIQPENRESVDDVLQSALAGNESTNYELPLLSKTENRLTVLLNATTRRDAKGHIIGVVGVGQEITELNKAMAESARVADDLIRLIETAHAPIFGVNTEGQVTEWNTMMQNLTEYSKEEALGRFLVTSFISKEYRGSVEDVLMLALKGVETANFEFPLFAKSLDRKVQILMSATPRRGPDGQVIGMIGVGQDITQLRAATEIAGRTASELSRLIDNANAPIFAVDMDYHITEWNQMMSKISGVPRAEVMGKLVMNWLSDTNTLQEAITGETPTFELRFSSAGPKNSKPNEVVLLLSASRRLNSAGDTVGVVCIGQNITEHKALEEKKMEFMAVVSHELRSPIHGICGLSEAMAAGEDDPRRKKQLKMIGNCSKRLLDLVTNIMDVSSIRSKTLKLSFGPCKVPQIIEETVHLLRHAVNTRGHKVMKASVQLINHVLDSSMPPIVADPHRITQVFMNLVMNALKFTKKGNVTLDGGVDKVKGVVTVCVADTGIGISEANIERIFEPFAQEGDGEARTFEGIGLGLAISREVVRCHGGDIRVESKLGVGSKFIVSLPIQATQAEVEPVSRIGSTGDSSQTPTDAVQEDWTLEGDDEDDMAASDQAAVLYCEPAPDGDTKDAMKKLGSVFTTLTKLSSSDLLRPRQFGCGLVLVVDTLEMPEAMESLLGLVLGMLQALEEQPDHMIVKVGLSLGPAAFGHVQGFYCLCGEAAREAFDLTFTGVEGCVHCSPKAQKVLGDMVKQKGVAACMRERGEVTMSGKIVRTGLLVPDEMLRKLPKLRDQSAGCMFEGRSAAGSTSRRKAQGTLPASSLVPASSPRDEAGDRSKYSSGGSASDRFKAQPSLIGDQIRLLSVDDDFVNQEVVQGIFESKGYEISVAMDGTSCLQHIEHDLPHMLLLDSMMPGMSGIEVCTTLRKRYNSLELPIIMLTCRSSPEEISAALIAGVNDYVCKPFNRIELLARVHAHARAKSEYDQALASLSGSTIPLRALPPVAVPLVAAPEKRPVQTSSIAIQTQLEAPPGDHWGSPVPVKVEAASDKKRDQREAEYLTSFTAGGSISRVVSGGGGSVNGSPDVMAKQVEVVSRRLEKLRQENKKLRMSLIEERRLVDSLKAQMSEVTVSTDSAFSQLVLIEEELEKKKQLLEDKDDLERIRSEVGSQCL